MKNFIYFGAVSSLGLSGCITPNPIITEPSLEKIEENAEIYNQTTINIAANELLLNVLRARDHGLRAYTSLSDVSMAPGGDIDRDLEAGGLGRGAAWSGFKSSISWSSNDKLSYTLGNASRSDGKNFADQRFDAETFNNFWQQTWPRGMLLHIFFQESAFEIVQNGEAANKLADYYALGLTVEAGAQAVRSREPFYVTADNGKLTYCLNAIEACVSKDFADASDDAGGSGAGAQDKVTVAIEVSLETKSLEKPKATKMEWDSGLPIGYRVADEFLQPINLVKEALYQPDETDRSGTVIKYGYAKTYKLLYCASDASYNVVTSNDFDGKPMTKPGSELERDSDSPVYRSLDLFKCSDQLSDFENLVAQPYFLVYDDATKSASIYQPKFSTFDNAIYLLGRSIRSGLVSKNYSEQTWCNFATRTTEACQKDKRLFNIIDASHSNKSTFNACADAFIAEVEYQGDVYRAGLPEENDNENNECVDEGLTPITLILLTKIVEYKIQRPTISTQLLLTQ